MSNHIGEKWRSNVKSNFQTDPRVIANSISDEVDCNCVVLFGDNIAVRFPSLTALEKKADSIRKQAANLREQRELDKFNNQQQTLF